MQAIKTYLPYLGCALLGAVLGFFAGRLQPIPTPTPTPVLDISLSPSSVALNPGSDPVKVTAKTAGKIVKWHTHAVGLTTIPLDGYSVYVFANQSVKAGTYKLYAYTAIDGAPTDMTACVVTVGQPPGPIPPDPVPPGPKPDPPGPTPDPAPIPASGFRVLIVYESAETSKLPTAQQSILYSQAMRDELNTKCVVGPDNKTKEWRIYDKDVAMGGESALWQAAMKRPRASVPWVVISNGTTGFEGPLPADVTAMKALLTKYYK